MSQPISIHYYIHGRGRGHASRSLPIIGALRDDGHHVTVFAGEDARALFDTQGAVIPIASVPTGISPSLPNLIRRRIQSARRALQQQPPRVLVSDGDLPSSVAAKSAGVPSVAIGHGLVFATCHRIPGAPRTAWWRERAKASLASLGASRHVAVNFAPLTPLDPSRTIVARPTLRGALSAGVQAPVDGEVVCYFRDDNGDRMVRDLVEAGHRPILFTKRRLTIPGVRVVPQDRDAFARALLRASAVVSSAGSQLISECVALGIPQFALFEAGDDEQRLNVSMLKHFGQGGGASFQAYRAQQLLETVSPVQPSTPSSRSSGRCTMPPIDAVSAMRQTIAALTQP